MCFQSMVADAACTHIIAFVKILMHVVQSQERTLASCSVTKDSCSWVMKPALLLTQHRRRVATSANPYARVRHSSITFFATHNAEPIGPCMAAASSPLPCSMKALNFELKTFKGFGTLARGCLI